MKNNQKWKKQKEAKRRAKKEIKKSKKQFVSKETLEVVWQDYLLKKEKENLDPLKIPSNMILDDIQNFLKNNDSKKSLDDYYEHIKKSKSMLCLGTTKKNYLEIIDSFSLIYNARKINTKKNSAESNALYFLHHQVGISPNEIKNILRLFGIQISTKRILDKSARESEKRFDF